MDEAADPSDQQHEYDRQLVDEQSDADVPLTAGDPVVERHAHRSGGDVAADELDEQHEAQREGDQRRQGAKQVAPSVGPPADQQDGGAQGRDGDQQA